MKETILSILRKTSLTDKQKLDEIFKILNEDRTEFYGANKLVKLDAEQIKKLNSMYGNQVVTNMIESVDAYVYKTGKRYASHYLTIIKWCSKAGIEQRKPAWKCKYGKVHDGGTDCNCNNF